MVRFDGIAELIKGKAEPARVQLAADTHRPKFLRLLPSYLKRISS
jgi:hypothetical protein